MVRELEVEVLPADIPDFLTLDVSDMGVGDAKHASDVAIPKGIRLKPGETAVFAFIVYKSRAHRDAVNAKVMKDPALTKMPKTMPFDMNRFMHGGFNVLVES